jgi:hypothetical protein
MNAQGIITGLMLGWLSWLTFYGGCHCASGRPLLKIGKWLLWLLTL